MLCTPVQSIFLTFDMLNAYDDYEGENALISLKKGYDIMFMDYDSGASCNKQDCTEKNSWRKEKHSWGLENYPLAMVYSPLQNFENTFDVDKALERGTIFCELDLPFKGQSVYNSCKGGCSRG